METFDTVSNKYRQQLITENLELEDTTNSILKEKGPQDLFVFNRYILNVEQGDQDFVEMGDFHKELCHFVSDNGNYKKLILLPRGHLKSKLVTVGYCVQQIVKNPSVRILIYNATWKMAVDFLGEIKRHLESNETLIQLFGNLAENPYEWSQDRIKLRASTKKEPTVMATGIDTNVVASHFDIIIFDDVVNRDNSTTQDQIEKVIKRYRDHNSLLEPNGQTIVIGTRWDDRDLYNWILDPSNRIKDSFKILSKSALDGYYWDESKREFIDSGAGKILWPQKYTLENLSKIRREMGSYDFSTQFMNDPVPDDQARFSRSYFQYYDREIIRNKQFNIITTVDPALSLDKEADFTAIMTVGIDEYSNLYILDIVRQKLTPDQIIQAIFDNYLLWKPSVIGVEDVAITKTLGYQLKQEQQRRNKFLPIRGVAPQLRTKFDRILGLQPIYENLKVWHPSFHSLTPYLEDELSRFPRAQHDDMIDALSYTLDFLYPPRHHRVRNSKSKYLYSS